MIEYKTSIFEKYRDDKHLPTCVINFEKGYVCKFYGTKDFGTKELCCFMTNNFWNVATMVAVL